MFITVIAVDDFDPALPATVVRMPRRIAESVMSRLALRFSCFVVPPREAEHYIPDAYITSLKSGLAIVNPSPRRAI